MKIQKWWGTRLRPRALVRGILEGKMRYARLSHVPHFFFLRPNAHQCHIESETMVSGEMMRPWRLPNIKRKILKNNDAFPVKNHHVHVEHKNKKNNASNNHVCTLLGEKIPPSEFGSTQHLKKNVLNNFQSYNRPINISPARQVLMKKQKYRHSVVPAPSSVEKKHSFFEARGCLSKQYQTGSVMDEYQRWGESQSVQQNKSLFMPQEGVSCAESSTRGATQRLALRRRSGGVDEMSSPQYPGLSVGYL
ncbi:hypothetical protein [Neokomagataea anthophila]|uniref:Uncharacterized protein n=1 Tax=Neokomagataea anthophila TaxID=2826925 RepID=A0ABS5E8V1_9PROT|nr:hypothetical protein [Neokomagataea anthophila]MBR0560334.1 hypothetical protein [Neokomagataea anthophila]